MSQVSQGAVRPLIAKVQEHIPTWRLWKQHFAAATLAEYVGALIDGGFNVVAGYADSVPVQEWEERILLYLDLAHGWASSTGWNIEGDSFRHSSLHCGLGCFDDAAELRQELARKAFAALCKHVFSFPKRSGDNSFFYRILESPIVVDKIIMFFRSQDGLEARNYNSFQHDELGAVAREFLATWCDLAFTGRHKELDLKAQVIECLCSRRHLLIPIMDSLRMLWVLTSSSVRIDARSVFELRHQVLSCDIWDGRSHRKPLNIEDAVAHGSKAAQVLIMLLITGRERVKARRRDRLAEKKRTLQLELDKIRMDT